MYSNFSILMHGRYVLNVKLSVVFMQSVEYQTLITYFWVELVSMRN